MQACLRFTPMFGAKPGELDDDDARALEAHLATCPGCRARAADQVALASLLSEALIAEANRRDFSSFADAVMERVSRTRLPDEG